MRRARPASILLLTASLPLLACAASGPQPHRGIEGLWRQFVQLPPKRALALAGNPERVWVAGAVGGLETQTEASTSALAECRRKRRERRMQAPCILYAVGNEIIWPSY